MDRDKRWERTERAYELLVKSKGERASDPVAAILRSYERGITDEFIEPTVIINAGGEPVATIQEGDAVIFSTSGPIAPDNLQEHLRSRTSRNLTSPAAHESNLFASPSTTDRSVTSCISSARSQERFGRSLGKDLHTQLSFGRNREVCPRDLFLSTAASRRNMGANVACWFHHQRFPLTTCNRRCRLSKVTDKVLRGIQEKETDVFIVNFANPDMVGHTGKLDKTIEACQYVDTCLGWITKAIRQVGGTTIITADHGNAEQMIDPQSGGPHTAHTTNPVPFH